MKHVHGCFADRGNCDAPDEWHGAANSQEAHMSLWYVCFDDSPYEAEDARGAVEAAAIGNSRVDPLPFGATVVAFPAESLAHWRIGVEKIEAANSHSEPDA